jgi:capsular exopolysaccharide synthesis family protein
VDVPAEEATLRDHWRVVMRRKALIAAAVLLSAGAALGISLSQTSVYVATTDVLVQPRTAGGLFQTSAGASQAISDRMVQTELKVIAGESVRERVRLDLGLDELPPRVNGAAVDRTDVVRLSVRSADPVTAAALVDGYATAYIEVRRDQAVQELVAASTELQETIDDLQARLDALDATDPRRSGLLSQQAALQATIDELRIDAALRTGGASVITPAEVPTEPVAPTPFRTAVLAALVGLALGLAIAFAVDHFDDSIGDAADLAKVTSLTVLSTVPVERMPDRRPIAWSVPADPAVEAYRGLRTNLQFIALDRTVRTVQVVSALPGEGKTTTASNLAVVLAQAGHWVLLVDADLRRPRMHEVFGLEASPGLTDVLLGAPPELSCREVAVEGAPTLRVCTAGSPPPNPSEMLSAARTRAAFAELASRYDFVVVDSAPVLPVADAVSLASFADAVLVVVQVGRTSEAELGEAIERLERVSAPTIGVVLNRSASVEGSAYAYGYGA